MTIWCPIEMSYIDLAGVARFLAEDAERLHTLLVELSMRPSHERVLKVAVELRAVKRHLAAMTFRLCTEGEGHVR